MIYNKCPRRALVCGKSAVALDEEHEACVEDDAMFPSHASLHERVQQSQRGEG